MATFGKPRVFGRIMVMVIVNIIIAIGGLIWFDYLGFIDLKSIFGPVYRLVGIGTRQNAPFPANSPSLLDDERYAKQMETLDAKREELAERERNVTAAEAEIAKKAQEIADREKTIADKEKSFKETLAAYDNKRANIDKNARLLTGMPPAKAVEILKSMDDQLIIDIMRMVDEIAKQEGTDSIVAYWLSLMPAERSAAIQRKMVSKPTGLGD